MTYTTPEETPFYLVWNKVGEFPPKHMHRTLDDAEQEAARLARSVPGGEFFVLRPVSSTRKSDVVIRRFEELGAVVPF